MLRQKGELQARCVVCVEERAAGALRGARGRASCRRAAWCAWKSELQARCAVCFAQCAWCAMRSVLRVVRAWSCRRDAQERCTLRACFETRRGDGDSRKTPRGKRGCNSRETCDCERLS